MQVTFCERPAFAKSASAQIFTPSPDKDPRKSLSNIGQRAGSISTVVDLLRLADKTLSRNQDETRRCIERALGLLTADSCAIDAAGEVGGSLRKPSLAPWQMNRVTSFIDSNLANTIRLRDLAAVTHLSRTHFSRAFRSMIGESPYAYVMRRRIDWAQEIMLRTDAPLAQIALDCGLADQAHFTRLFRRIVGASPGAWRRLNGKTERDGVAMAPSA
jgi:AraC-like DNA-binding protein